MADEDKGAAKAGNGAAPAAPKEQAPQVKMQILTQFVRDLSFENVLAQKGIGGDVQPDVTVTVNMDAKKRSAENQYEVIIKSTIQSKNKGTEDMLFMLELEYAGVFLVDNVPEDQLHPFLMIECPRMLFPFFRRIVSDVTRDGGFPPLNLENIDFVGIYRQEIMRRQAEMAKGDQPIV
ncbi:protein-export chaperone SecB [Roseovarius sp. LXJ103]|uniref:protein-export chaperone SecB n=1 Tax=Roseovarius carneus TaxID=2853164 RepID=UPI000D60D0B2|nr:protein-export chaperone SecB [Roseovarius carneus]MBZ8117926.1 protein-export chaperone SecB [Roseovarius carneus]PWE36320.1 protein-export chaperone SecB [Pelagicola sp. LXJ1103]